jgi:hypothetical protein
MVVLLTVTPRQHRDIRLGFTLFRWYESVNRVSGVNSTSTSCLTRL